MVNGSTLGSLKITNYNQTKNEPQVEERGRLQVRRSIVEREKAQISS